MRENYKKNLNYYSILLLYIAKRHYYSEMFEVERDAKINGYKRIQELYTAQFRSYSPPVTVIA